MLRVEISNIPDTIMRKVDFEENEIYLKITAKTHTFGAKKNAPGVGAPKA